MQVPFLASRLCRGIPILSSVAQSSSHALLHLVTSPVRFLQPAVPGHLCGGLAPASSPANTTSQPGLPYNMGIRSRRLVVPLKLWPAARAWSLRLPIPAVSCFGHPFRSVHNTATSVAAARKSQLRLARSRQPTSPVR
ncbi:hypothetical protein HPB50_024402 [Hyalomma asiaticum]|uniref:Uncharacterized protein n=1 Tax=Hyalomma asiaticum TaxID=266040 RepID=A0ACB7SFF3_HYAAI|nr:hypothetical protein HPB50_024402 [Hyalomma asiaticum]